MRAPAWKAFWLPTSLPPLKIRSLLVLLVLATIIPLLALGGILLTANVRLQDRLAEELYVDTARALGLAVDRELRATAAALEVLTTSPLLDRGDYEDFYDRATSVGQVHRGWLVLSTPENQALMHTARPLGTVLPPGLPRDAAAVVASTAGPLVTGVFTETLVERPVIAVVVPVVRRGEVRFLLAMELVPEHIATLLGTQNPNPSWSATVIDRGGQVVASVPDTTAIGRTPPPALLAAMRRTPEGWHPSVTFDDTSSYFAFAPVAYADWTLALGVPLASAYAEANRPRRLMVAGALTALLLGPLLASAVGRRIAAPLARLAVAARANDLAGLPTDPDPGVSEIADVDRALRDAVESRQRENLERQQRVAEEARRQAAEQALAAVAASEERWRALFEQAGEAILIGDLAGVCRDANPAACRALRYTRAELVGAPLSRIVSAGDVMHLPETLTSLLERDTHAAEWTLIRKDGTLLPAEVNARMLLDGRWQAFIRDATERRRAEQERARALASEQSARCEAESASRMKDEFLANLSHEMRTPLSAMHGWVNLLRSGQLDAATTARALDAIDRSVRAQSFLIRDLMDVTRIARGTLTLDVDRCDLSRIVNESCGALQPGAEANGIALTCIVEPDTIGTFDPDRIQQVVWNLVTNALKFTPSGGRVEVRVERVAPDVATLTVCDTGRGIPPGFLPYVFERFQQHEAGGAGASRGLGIGLAIVKYVTEAHGGTVTVDSEGAGKGATFTVTLPLTPSRSGATVAAASAP